ncbi:HDOD domain-containing protein [Oxalobacteraceae bacterium CAVE-383]|nr:HDOD domain-containing protein [Oxalobacteraceae bacterium CAVE-383]
MDKIDAFRNIAAQAGRGELVFPTNVDASMKLQKALEDPECHLEAAAKMVLLEPLVAARAVAIANSVAYNRSGAEIASVRAAVMRLGFRTLHSLVAAVMVRQMTGKVANPALKAKANRLWEHTAHVAALSQILAKRLTRVDPEIAMFAGIVHEVGGFYLLSRAEEFPGLLEGDSEDWAEYGEKLIGRGVLKKLAVPEIVLTAVESLWTGIGEQPPLTLGDILLLANMLAPVPSPLHPEIDAASAAVTEPLEMEIDGEALGEILEENREEIKSLTAALMF